MKIITRARELENAVREYLDMRKYLYISSKNQTIKCYNCGRFQRVRTQGFDFFVFWPKEAMAFIECKTGKSALTGPQKDTKLMAEEQGIPYVIVRDTLDTLIGMYDAH